MNVHDWTRVEPDVFHDFHHRWTTYLTDALNDGVLPPGFVALSETHYGERVADILTRRGPRAGRPVDPPAGAVAVADRRPRVARQQVIEPTAEARRRTVAVRQTGTSAVVAVIEVVSPSNKDRPLSVEDFAGKVSGTLVAGVHVVVLDLLPPGRHAPGGIGRAVADALGLPPGTDADDASTQPADAPVALLSYESRLPQIELFASYLRVGEPIPEVPLFLAPGHYVPAPVAASYAEAVRRMSPEFRGRLEPPPA